MTQDSKVELFKQCTLEKPLPSGGKYIDVAWIPIEFAKIGRHLKIREGGVWKNGWVVTNVAPQFVTYDDLIDTNIAYKHHREVTDI